MNSIHNYASMVAYVSVSCLQRGDRMTILIYKGASIFITIPYCVTVTHCAIVEIKVITGNADNILLLCIIFCDLLLGSAVPINIDVVLEEVIV